MKALSKLLTGLLLSVLTTVGFISCDENEGFDSKFYPQVRKGYCDYGGEKYLCGFGYQKLTSTPADIPSGWSQYELIFTNKERDLSKYPTNDQGKLIPDTTQNFIKLCVYAPTNSKNALPIATIKYQTVEEFKALPDSMKAPFFTGVEFGLNYREELSDYRFMGKFQYADKYNWMKISMEGSGYNILTVDKEGNVFRFQGAFKPVN